MFLCLDHQVGLEEDVEGLGQLCFDLVGRRQAITRAGGHRVGLGPDDLGADHPAVFGHGQCHPFWSEQQALRQGALVFTSGEAVAEVQPQRTGWLQHAGQTAQHQTKFVDPGGDAVFESDLLVLAVVAEPVVRRTGDNAVNRCLGKCRQDVTDVADQELVARQHVDRVERVHDSSPRSVSRRCSGVVTTKSSVVSVELRSIRARRLAATCLVELTRTPAGTAVSVRWSGEIWPKFTVVTGPPRIGVGLTVETLASRVQIGLGL